MLNRVGIASGLPLSENLCNKLHVFFFAKIVVTNCMFCIL